MVGSDAGLLLLCRRAPLWTGFVPHRQVTPPTEPLHGTAGVLLRCPSWREGSPKGGTDEKPSRLLICVHTGPLVQGSVGNNDATVTTLSHPALGATAYEYVTVTHDAGEIPYLGDSDIAQLW